MDLNDLKQSANKVIKDFKAKSLPPFAMNRVKSPDYIASKCDIPSEHAAMVFLAWQQVANEQSQFDTIFGKALVAELEKAITPAMPELDDLLGDTTPAPRPAQVELNQPQAKQNGKTTTPNKKGHRFDWTDQGAEIPSFMPGMSFGEAVGAVLSRQAMVLKGIDSIAHPVKMNTQCLAVDLVRQGKLQATRTAVEHWCANQVSRLDAREILEKTLERLGIDKTKVPLTVLQNIQNSLQKADDADEALPGLLELWGLTSSATTTEEALL